MTLILTLVGRPNAPLSDNLYDQVFSSLRGHSSYLDGRKGEVLLDGCFPTSTEEIHRLEALCRACTDFGARAELRLGDTRGAVIVMVPIGT